MKRIGLAVESPACLLSATQQATDLDFVIGHHVLEDADYAAHYRNRPEGRECILDNSNHELGAAVDLSALLQAAELVKPDYIISPDKAEDVSWTIEQYHILCELLSGGPRTSKIAVVLGGPSEDERARLLDATSEADMLCIAYDQPRISWYLEHLSRTSQRKRLHLLGVSELEELNFWKGLLSMHDLTIDTGKPVKYGLLGTEMWKLGSLRKPPLPSRELLKVEEASKEQERLVVENIRFLRYNLSA